MKGGLEKACTLTLTNEKHTTKYQRKYLYRSSTKSLVG